MSDFRVHILASGSKGNAALVQAGGTAVLVDAGISAKRINAGLAQAGVRPCDLTGIFITHEHVDHIRGLPVFLRKAQVPVFANESTWFASGFLGKIQSSVRRLLPDGPMRIGELTLHPFKVSHDAAAPVGFNFFYRDRKCSFATDMGYAPDGVKEALSGSDTIILEANHDDDMLRDGSYPYYLKERIRGRQGHLSNRAAGELLAQVIACKKTEVFLAHLSQENNRPGLALETVKSILSAKGVAQKTSIYIASQEQMVSNCNKESDAE